LTSNGIDTLELGFDYTHRANRRTHGQDSGPNWMKDQRQVSLHADGHGPVVCTTASIGDMRKFSKNAWVGGTAQLHLKAKSDRTIGNSSDAFKPIMW
jgi:hypothetical protein